MSDDIDYGEMAACESSLAKLPGRPCPVCRRRNKRFIHPTPPKREECGLETQIDSLRNEICKLKRLIKGQCGTCSGDANSTSEVSEDYDTGYSETTGEDCDEGCNAEEDEEDCECEEPKPKKRKVQKRTKCVQTECPDEDEDALESWRILPNRKRSKNRSPNSGRKSNCVRNKCIQTKGSSCEEDDGEFQHCPRSPRNKKC